MTSAIRPYTHAAKPPTRREPVPPAPTPLSPGAAWLDKCAEYWQAQGYTLQWIWDNHAKGYAFSVWDAERRMFIATVGLVE